jgi:membrane-associated protease RseP (regulator of RpoE activity)
MTDETAPGAAAPEDAPPEDAVPAASVEPAARKGVFVPRWLAILLGVVIAVGLVGGGGFALGRSTADDDHHERVEDRREGPSGPPPLGDRDGRGGENGGNGGNGGGSGGSTPTPPIPTSRVYLGVGVARESGTDGARVVQVVSGSPADKAGLEVDDLITAVDGTAVTDATELATAIQGHDAGDTVAITYDRAGSSSTATVELAERSQPGLPGTSPPA